MKNVARVTFVGVLALIAISLLSEFRRDKPGEFGRLYHRRTKDFKTEPVREPMVIVEEEPLPDRIPDPMLVHSVDHDAVLGVEPPVPHPPSVEQPVDIAGAAPLGQYDGSANKPSKARFEIVGGAGGVHVKVQ